MYLFITESAFSSKQTKQSLVKKVKMHKEVRANAAAGKEKLQLTYPTYYADVIRRL